MQRRQIGWCPPSQAVYEAKLKGLAATINSQAPDVLALQEIGDLDALHDLIALLDGNWQRRVSSLPDRRGIRVAWLSRHPITHAADAGAMPLDTSRHSARRDVSNRLNVQANPPSP